MAVKAVITIEFPEGNCGYCFRGVRGNVRFLTH